MKRIVVAGVLTGVIDGLFSSVLSAVFYGSTVTRLFQGVAATLLGPNAVDGGVRTALIGVAMHFGVALGWSAVFAFLVSQFEWLRRTLAACRRPDSDRVTLRPAHLDDDVAGDHSGTDRPAGVDYLSLVGAVLRPHPIRCAADRDGDRATAAENTLTGER
jgi:hypothetical protein